MYTVLKSGVTVPGWNQASPNETSPFRSRVRGTEGTGWLTIRFTRAIASFICLFTWATCSSRVGGCPGAFVGELAFAGAFAIVLLETPTSSLILIVTSG